MIAGCDLDDRMRARSRGPADQERNVHAFALHFARVVCHLLERRRNEPRQPDDVAFLVARDLRDPGPRHHHAQVDDFVIVALEHDGDDVLADIMDIAFDGREHDFALRARIAGLQFFGFDERDQVRDRLFHDARAFHHLRQKHLARAEEIADHVHAVHQRAFDHLDRAAAVGEQFLARFLGILDHVIGDAAHQRVGEPRLDRAFAPLKVFDLHLAAALHRLGEFHHALGGIRPAVEYDVLDVLEELLGDLVVNADLAGVDDRHREAGFHRVIQERGVDRLAHAIVAAERKRNVRQPAAHFRVRQVLAYPLRRGDKVLAVIAMLFDAGRDREYIRIDDHVFRQEADVVDENLVRAPADLAPAFERIGLAFLVKRHHHDRSTIAAREFRVLDELFLAFLHADRIDHALALHALQPRLDHVPPGGVDHDRHARNVGLRRDQLQEGRHRGLRIKHRLVHVDIYHLRAVFDLLARDRERCRIVAGENQPRERFRARHVGALADVDKQRVVADVERFQARQECAFLDDGHLARRNAAHRIGDRLDVRGGRAAAAADDVEKTALREFLDQARRVLGRFVVAGFGQRIGQARVRISGHKGVGDARQFLYVRPHELGAQRAIESDSERLCMAHGIPERFGRLARQRAARRIRDRAGDDDRQLDAVIFEIQIDCEQRGLGVECVENGLDQQEIDAALDQTVDGLGVSRNQLVVRDVAKTRIVDVGGNRRGAIGRPQCAGHETRPAVLLFDFVGHRTRESGRFEIQFVDQVLHSVVGLRDRGRVKRVGLDQVGARGEILRVDFADDRGLRERQKVVVAFEIAREVLEALAAIAGLIELVALDHGAHRAVQYDDALVEQFFQCVCAFHNGANNTSLFQNHLKQALLREHEGMYPLIMQPQLKNPICGRRSGHAA